MKTVVENSKYLTLIAVISLLIASFGAFFWGGSKTLKAVSLVVSSYGTDPQISVLMIQTIDAFLVALALYIFAVSIYELFVGKLSMPGWMVAHNYHELKVRLSGLVILVIAVYFAEKLVQGMAGAQLLYLAGAVALVSFSLVAFIHFSGEH